MAKKRRSEITTTTGTKGAEELGIDEPFPASPGRPGAYCLYIEKGTRTAAWIYASAYAARKCLDILLADDTISKIKGVTGQQDTIVSSTGIKVRCSEMDELVDYEYSAAEEQWVLPEPYSTWAASFRMDFVERSPDSPNASPGEPRPVREKKEKKPKINREGLISIGEIAEEMKMEPREARSILRGAKVQKPEEGWLWKKTEVDNIKKILQNNK